jgi:uncharacterized protein YdhG (YjbR/CyaY superfamily)
MQSTAKTVVEYLAELPEDRRAALSKVRAAIRRNLPKGFAETMQYGMIGYVVPHKLYPAGYHCKPADPLPFAALASQKNHMAVYLMAPKEQQAALRDRFAAEGKKLDMGKSCIRFRKLEDISLEAIGEAVGKLSVADYIAWYESEVKRK